MSDFDQPVDRGTGGDVPDDVVVTRSQEELRITVHAREAGRARLAKYLETATVTRTIPVRREQVRIEYEPVSPEGEPRHRPGPAPVADADTWLVLYEEEIVVHTRWVARERVRLRTHAVGSTQEISEQVREERIELDADCRPSVTPAAGTNPDATGPTTRTTHSQPTTTEDLT